MDWSNTLQRLREDKGKWSYIARKINMHPNGLRKIAIGLTRNPRLDSLEKITAFYADERAQR